jgi:hypothetical protein
MHTLESRLSGESGADADLSLVAEGKTASAIQRCAPQKSRPAWEPGLSAQDGMLWHDERMVTFAGIALRLIEDGLRWLVLLLRSTGAYGRASD